MYGTVCVCTHSHMRARTHTRRVTDLRTLEMVTGGVLRHELMIEMCRWMDI